MRESVAVVRWLDVKDVSEIATRTWEDISQCWKFESTGLCRAWLRLWVDLLGQGHNVRKRQPKDKGQTHKWSREKRETRNGIRDIAKAAVKSVCAVGETSGLDSIVFGGRTEARKLATTYAEVKVSLTGCCHN